MILFLPELHEYSSVALEPNLKLGKPIANPSLMFNSTKAQCNHSFVCWWSFRYIQILLASYSFCENCGSGKELSKVWENQTQSGFRFGDIFNKRACVTPVVELKDRCV